jgi:hypothetical protein
MDSIQTTNLETPLNRLWCFIISIALASFLVPRMHAQQPQTAPACARSEFRLFLPLAGTWDVEWTTRVTPGKYVSTKAVSRIDRDSIACVLVEHFFGEVNGKPLTSLVLLNFANPEKLERILIDSGHRQFLSFTGEQESNTVRFEWQRDLGTRRLMTRHDYRDIQADSFTTEWFLSPDSGKTWEMVQQAKYRRRQQ